MVKREFFNAIVNGEITEEVITMAKEEIAKLDTRNEKRRTTPTKAQVANEEVKTAILEAVTNGKHLAAEIGAAVGVSTQKASALLALLVKDGKVNMADYKVKGKGTVKSYTLAE